MCVFCDKIKKEFKFVSVFLIYSNVYVATSGASVLRGYS